MLSLYPPCTEKNRKNPFPVDNDVSQHITCSSSGDLSSPTWWALTSSHPSFMTSFTSFGPCHCFQWIFASWTLNGDLRSPSSKVKVANILYSVFILSHETAAVLLLLLSSYFPILVNSSLLTWLLWDSPSSLRPLAWRRAAALEEPESMSVLVLGQGSGQLHHEKLRI